MYSKELEELFAKQGISISDKVKIRSQKGEFEGRLMPRPEIGDNSILVVKLDNGYNIGIKFSAGTTIEKTGNIPKQEKPKAHVKISKDLPKIGLIYTGGTIGSKIDYLTGGVFMLTKPEELLSEVPELADIANIEVNNLMSIASEDMTYIEWQKIAKAVADALNNGSRGVVITHGTDTMHYSSAALSFMLKNLNAPVIITGSQRSSDRGSSDAFLNLICSVQLAAKSDIAEVAICMHESPSDTYCSAVRGTKARKMHTSRRDAFKPINNNPIARVNSSGNINYLSDYRKVSNVNEHKKVEVVLGFEPKVALIKTYPNSDPGIIDYYVSKGYKGIILEGTGLGHTPVSTANKDFSWLGKIKTAIDSGLIIGMTSQCLYGRVNKNVYRNLRLLSSAGVVYCEDMLPEVAYVKLGFLLGNFKKEEARSMLSENITGEITPRTEIEWFI
jgi:glutamyl-tRNA(Gln) amidotransferase subunit D